MNLKQQVQCVNPDRKCDGIMNKMFEHKVSVCYNCPRCREEFYWNKQKKVWQRKYIKFETLESDISPEF